VNRPAQPSARLPLSGMRARSRAMECCLLGLAGGVVAAIWVSPGIAVLIGWDVAVVAYLLWVWVSIRTLDAGGMAQVAAYEDDTRAATDLVLLGAAVASLAAAAFVLPRAGHSRGQGQSPWVAPVLVLAATFVDDRAHDLHASLCRLYSGGASHGVDFDQPEPPAYADFAYLAFTVGMAYQVSHTSLRTREFRRTALRHAMLSYVLRTGVLATTSNLVANLSDQAGDEVRTGSWRFPADARSAHRATIRYVGIAVHALPVIRDATRGT
jgi:uncharacterized membrane protein